MVKNSRNNFSFPKGKLKKKESLIDGALREVYEETGYDKDEFILQKDMNDDYITFTEEKLDKSKDKIKKITYYLGIVKDNKKKLEYDNKEILWCGWIKFNELINFKNNILLEDRIDIAKQVAKRILKVC